MNDRSSSGEETARPQYVNVLEARSASIQSRLPLEVDEPMEGGSAFDREIQRLNESWYTWTWSDERRLGVGSDVIVEAGVPIQVAGSFKHYNTTGEIRGRLVKETTVRYVSDHPRRHSIPSEATDALFTVTVELPSNDEPESFLNPRTVDIHVPNDRLRKVESPAEDLQG